MQQESAAPSPTPATSSSLTVQFLGTGPQNTPRLGLGLAALGRPGYINLGHGGDLTSPSTSAGGGSGSSASSSGRDVEGMRQHCWQMLDEAWALGVRYFDAARSYGRAEEFLAGWLQARGIAPDAVVVGSKWG
jgi:aryl-alcohol dehydrogenase-like predicted oxidoreductase